MILKNIFPNTYQHSPNHYEIWQHECDVNDDKFYDILLTIFNETFNHIYSLNTEVTNDFINSIFDEINAAKGYLTLDSELLRLEYLQFTWGLMAIYRCNRLGEFHYCHGYFFRSLYDRIHENFEEYDLNTYMIIRFIETNDSYILKNSETTIDSWFNELYYYSRSFSGLNDWCDFFFPLILQKIYNTNIYNSEFPTLISNLYVWGEINSKKEECNEIYNLIKQTYASTPWSANTLEFKKKLGLQLLLCNVTTQLNKVTIATELNSQPLNPLEKLQIDSELLISNNIISQPLITSLIESTKNYTASIHNEIKDEISLTYEKARIFKVLYKAIIFLLENKSVNHAIHLLISYYDIALPDKNEILFIIPNQEDGLSFYLENKKKLNPFETSKLIPKLVDIENKVFTSFRMLKGHGDKQIFDSSSKDIGTPNSKYSSEFLNTLNQVYDFTLIKDKIKTVNSVCQFDFNSLPIQAVMFKQTENILPINLSLSEKTTFKPIRKILFWKGNSFSSEIELNSLKNIFKESKILIDVLEEGSFEKEDLFECIKNHNHDLIWISSHGEHGHYEPNKSKIVLSQTEAIEIRDYDILKQNLKNRRTLFFNTCEGGLHTQTGEFKNVGFPNLLVNNYQDVLGHLWMVDYKIAMVYGVLFGIGLKNDLNPFDSYKLTISNLIQGKQAVIETLKASGDELTELIEMLENANTHDWNSILSWGSSAYYI